MGRTLSHETTFTRYPVGWVVAIIAVAVVVAAGLALTSKTPSPDAPIKFEALDENFAP